jgi:GDP/UDP-N,N'-diacetylbacillosamine 2-epimerase (hydrolysing)
MNKKIAVVTGARSEFGLLSGLMKKIEAQSELELQTIVTGMHLSPEFGLTYKQILEEGIRIDETIEMLLSSDTSIGITKSIGLGVIGFAETLARLKPDLIVLLGDRYETLAAAQAACIAKIPIAHLHGGELTEGAYDDAIRHSITKMSHLHFAASEEYRRRIIQMGEHPESVFNVGALALDAIYHLKPMSRQTLENEFSIQFKERLVVITYHPETLSNVSVADAFQEVLNAISTIQNATLIFTEANADTNGRIINEMIRHFCDDRKSYARSFSSLGQKKYLSLLLESDLVVGNSSSGLIEVPYFKKPTINVGNRQKGRLSPLSVIHCDASYDSLNAAIQKALSTEFLNSLSNIKYLYGDLNEEVSEKIVNTIMRTELKNLIQKRFYDLKGMNE